MRKNHIFVGNKSWSWRGGRSRNKRGYIIIFSPKHPKAFSHKKYMYEHILVIEEMLNRFLTKNEIVHHINGIKDDNRRENLLVCSQSEHRRLHNGWWKENEKWWKICPICKDKKEVNNINFYRRKSGIYVNHCKLCNTLVCSKRSLQRKDIKIEN